MFCYFASKNIGLNQVVYDDYFIYTLCQALHNNDVIAGVNNAKQAHNLTPYRRTADALVCFRCAPHFSKHDKTC